MRVPKHGYVVPETDEQREMREATERVARRVAAEAKRVMPVLTVTPAEMAEHLDSCRCHLHLTDLNQEQR